jgi:hypothetical protein
MDEEKREIDKREEYERPVVKREGELKDVTAGGTGGMTQVDPPMP